LTLAGRGIADGALGFRCLFACGARLRVEFLVVDGRRRALHLALALRAATDLAIGRGALRQHGASQHGRDGKRDRRGFRKLHSVLLGLIGDDVPLFRAPSIRNGSSHRSIVANGARSMQAAPCGQGLGISGQFRENLATDRPNMRQRGNCLLA
jgi:hypothetical protein